MKWQVSQVVVDGLVVEKEQARHIFHDCIITSDQNVNTLWGNCINIVDNNHDEIEIIYQLYNTTIQPVWCGLYISGYSEEVIGKRQKLMFQKFLAVCTQKNEEENI